MSLELQTSGFEFRQKQVCGRCSTIVNNVGIYEGAVVMVRPRTATDKATGWGDSSYHGKVILPHDKAMPITDKKGVIHFIVPTAVEGLSVSGRISKVQAYGVSLGHDLLPLP